MIKKFFILFSILNALDICSTYCIISLGGMELNQVWFVLPINMFLQMVIFKSISIITICCMTNYVYKHVNVIGAYIIMIITLLMYVIVDVNNFYQIVIHEGWLK